LRLRGISRSAGLPPGILGSEPDEHAHDTTINLFNFNATEVLTESLSDADAACSSILTEKTSWMRITGFRDTATIQKICEGIGLHPLLIEDIFNTHQRPGLEASDDSVFVTLNSISSVGEKGLSQLRVSMILTNNCVITVEESPIDLFDGLVDRILKDKGRIRKNGNDYLAYAILDVLVDGYFLVLEQVSDQMEGLETELAENPDPGLLARIQSLRNQMLMLRKAVWPLREVISGLSRDHTALISQPVVAFFRDVYDHTIQVIDTAETLREILSGMVDTYLSSISNRMNQVMKVLTVVATIFIPLTFIAGVYGMNFHFMPELPMKWGYFAALGLMVIVALGMLTYFRKKKWL
jgi:magnesium transporter